MKFKRYEVVMYCDECGLDEGLDFSNFKDAERYAKELLKNKEDYGLWESTAIYDYKTRTCKAVYNGLPEMFFNADVIAHSTPRIVWVKVN